jgi:hypothetical protein
MVLKEELYNTGLTLHGGSNKNLTLREIKKIVKDRCNDTDRHNIAAKMSEKSSLTLHPEMNLCQFGGTR